MNYLTLLYACNEYKLLDSPGRTREAKRTHLLPNHCGRSKAAGLDGCLPLGTEMPTALSSDLQRPMSLRQPDGSPQSRDTKTLKIMSSEPSYPNIHPYQVRHRDANYDAAHERRSSSEILARMHHSTDATTQKRNYVGGSLAQGLAGTLARAAPQMMRPSK